MSKLSNCLKMLELLSSGRMYSTKELSERLEVNRRMIRLYKEEIEQAGIFVSTVRGPYGGYFIDYDFNTPIRGITSAEIAYLKTNFSNDSKVFEIVKKLETIIINEKNIFINEEEKNMYNIISECIIKNKKIKILYKSSDGSLNNRVVHPSSLANNSGVWRVVGFCEYKQDIRRFRLLSIISFQILEETF